MTTEQQWDVVSSVGLTALAVAAGRAIDTHRADSLVRDPFAERFVDAAQPPIPMLTRPPQTAGQVDEATQIWSRIGDHMGVRSRFFDRYLQQSCQSGARQVVLLASGLDTRGFRLDWPEGVRLFEIDQPKVLEFKSDVLRQAGARPSCTRHTVPVDLRADWAHALTRAGFDPAVPTAWLAEGLLPYLPPHAEQRLLETMHGLSAPGSHVALEHMRGVSSLLDDPTFAAAADEFGVDLRGLVHDDERPDPDIQLASLGWRVAIDVADEVARRYERAPDALAARLSGNVRFVTAALAR